MAKRFQRVDETERRLVRNMKREGVAWSTIQKVTGRSTDTIRSILAKKRGKPKQQGAPKKMDAKAVAKVLQSTRVLQKMAGGRKEVSAAMVKAHAGVDVSDRTMKKAYRENNIKFYKLKERPILTKDDRCVRLGWARKRKPRSKRAWVHGRPHAIIDNKRYQCFTNRSGRDHAARRSVRGAYQTKGQLPDPHLVKPKGGALRFPAKGVMVTAAVIKGKIRMWEYVDGRWNGDSASAMYRGPLLKAMSKAFPEHAAKSRAKWVVLEDNDPSGYKCTKGKVAKLESGIISDDLPPRSPDLNVLDYALWHAINVRMRLQEAEFPKSKRETQEEFKARLRTTAMRLPTALVQKCVGDMRRRCDLVIARKGGLFKE